MANGNGKGNGTWQGKWQWQMVLVRLRTDTHLDDAHHVRQNVTVLLCSMLPSGHPGASPRSAQSAAAAAAAAAAAPPPNSRLPPHLQPRKLRSRRVQRHRGRWRGPHASVGSRESPEGAEAIDGLYTDTSSGGGGGGGGGWRRGGRVRWYRIVVARGYVLGWCM